MANDQAARITGTVLRVSERSGNKLLNAQTGESRAWKMTTARVLVGGVDVCDVTLNDNLPQPDQLDSVDWLVRISAGGRFLNVDYVDEWSSTES